MKRLLHFAFILLTITFFVSCEKQPDTDIEIIEKQLQEFVSDNGLSKCTIIDMNGETSHTEHTNVDFSISNGFVIVNASGNYGEYQDRYNLLYLSKYMLDSNNNLVLYFANTHF
ncbi:MAG: hypothetical protein H6Q25_401 [Bacteroidetes bacterium]|nr:hypothetical protein [Bacteroidota bacterium]